MKPNPQVLSTRPAAVPAMPEVSVANREPEPLRAGSLIPRYTFDSFVMGSSNRFAHAAAGSPERSRPALIS